VEEKMFDGALGVVMVIGPFVLAVALIYAVLQYRHRNRTLGRHRERAMRQLYADARAQRAHLRGDAGARPSYPTPNDIT
jgi:hypothetical protein